LITPVFAESPAVLTWPDCVRLAAERNLDLQSNRRAQQSSRAAYLGSYNGILPQLSLQNSYTKGKASTDNSASESWRAQGTASLNLINFNQWATIRSTKASWQQSQANFGTSSTNVLFNLYKAFAGTLYAQQQISVAKKIQAIWQTDAELIRLRYASGRESKGNQMRTDAELLQAQVDLLQAGRDLRVAQQTLSQVLGEEQYKAWIVTGTWTSGSLPPSPPNLDLLLDHEPRLLAQQALIDQARAAVASAHSSFWPNVSVSYNRGFQDSTEFPTANPYWTFTGLLNYPLFGGGPTATYFASASAQRSLEKAQLDLRALRNQIRSDLESAWSGYVQAVDQVRTQRAFLEAARQRREESDIRYQSGLMSFEEWQLVVADLVNFEKSYLKSQQNLLLAEAQWRFAAGEQLGDRL
jgi:outer membrane protein